MNSTSMLSNEESSCLNFSPFMRDTVGPLLQIFVPSSNWISTNLVDGYSLNCQIDKSCQGPSSGSLPMSSMSTTQSSTMNCTALHHDIGINMVLSILSPPLSPSSQQWTMSITDYDAAHSTHSFPKEQSLNWSLSSKEKWPSWRRDFNKPWKMARCSEQTLLIPP